MSAKKRSTPRADSDAEGLVQTSSWTDVREPRQRRFPGPPDASAALRVLFAREAFAEIGQHARESLHAEVCGVLVGEVSRDDDGVWVEVTAAVRGSSTQQGAQHVTFTHETWARIHEQIDREHPKRAIVGWYHSHPGFGVEFSEMDAFIQRNFFSGLAQVALVTDPVAGCDALCFNHEQGIRYVDRCWVDGRERTLRVPAKEGAAAPGGGPGATSGDGAASADRLAALETRIGQLIAAHDELRERIWSWFLVIGLAVLVLVSAYVGVNLWILWTARHQPPQVLQRISLPFEKDGKRYRLTADVLAWEVPLEESERVLRAVLEERLREQEAAAAAAAAEQQDESTNTEDRAPSPPAAAPPPPAEGTQP